MTQEEKDQIVAAWIEYNSTPDEDLSREEKEAKKEFAWAFWELWEMNKENPETAWEIILQIHRTEHSEWTTVMLAAGPMEDLLAEHGEKFIERVETEARRDPQFNYMLGGVWQNSTSEEVWARVLKIRNQVW